jgi:tetratricopeptide (TPR) repeat protein
MVLSLVAGLILLICGALAIPGVRRIALLHTEIPFTASSGDWVRAGEPYLKRYDLTGYQQKAIDAFQRAIELDNTNASAYVRLSEAYLSHVTGAKTAHWAKLALDAARAAITLNPYLAAAHASAGGAMIALGQLDEADKELHQALALDPKNAAAHSYQGASYERKHALKEAEAEHRKAAELAPADWVFHCRLGDFLYQAGRSREAIQAYQAGLKLGSDNPILNSDLGAAFHAVGQDDDAAVALPAIFGSTAVRAKLFESRHAAVLPRAVSRGCPSLRACPLDGCHVLSSVG